MFLCFSRFLKPDLAESEKYSVLVSHSTSPNDFWCQLEKSTEMLQNIADSLQESYSADSESVPMTDLEPGKVCVVLCSEDNLYYRSGITSVIEDKVDVIFVDYGNCTTVDKSEVKIMKSEHLEICHQAFPCRLANMTPNTYSGNWTDEACTRFKQLTAQKRLVAEIVELNPGTILHVVLYDNEDSMSTCLVNEGFALDDSVIEEIDNVTRNTTISDITSESDSEGEFHSTEEVEADLPESSHQEIAKKEEVVVETEYDENEVYEESEEQIGMNEGEVTVEDKLESRLESSQESDMTSGDELEISAVDTGLDNSITCPYVFRKLNIDDEYIVTISEVVNPDRFFVRVKADETEQEDLYREITAYVKNNADEKLDRYQLGEACLAFCHQTNVWCRGRIDDVNKDDIDVSICVGHNVCCCLDRGP